MLWPKTISSLLSALCVLLFVGTAFAGRDGTGAYTAPSNSFNPAVTGQPIDPTDWNAILNDLESALSESVYTDDTSSTDNCVIRADGTNGLKVQKSAMCVDDSGNVTGVAGITASGVLTLPNAGLHILDTNASHDLILAPGSDLSADRTLTLTTGDADRTLTLSGNPTISDWFDQSVKTTGNPQFATIEMSHATANTFACSSGHCTIEGATIWDSGNDGSGSGLDADTVDGIAFSPADAGADAIFGWDDTASAYENLTSAEATATLDVMVGDSGAGGTKGLVPAPGAGDSSKFFKGDGSWATIPGGGDLLAANNLSDVNNASTSLSNLGGQPRMVGAFFWHTASTCPSYALLADGSSKSRATYADLWAEISGDAVAQGSKDDADYGTGDGSTTFTLMDLTTDDHFIRAGTYGTEQADQFQGHIHQMDNAANDNASGGAIRPTGPGSAVNTSGPVTDGVNGTPRTGSETRPKNISLTPCIVF